MEWEVCRFNDGFICALVDDGRTYGRLAARFATALAKRSMDKGSARG